MRNIIHGGDPLSVRMDPSQVDQILANLCVNARDSIENVGRVSIGTENVSLDDGYCQDHNGFCPGEYVVMRVSDTGCGMSRETLEHIFEPFYTTKGAGKGTGLGLAMVYGIMKQNMGFINAYSEPEKGSVFRIYFPRHAGNSLEPSRQAPMEINSTGWETILLVEDERAIMKLVQTRLGRLGYTVLGFSSPKAAIEASHGVGAIDLLITDVVMPEMNGRDLAKKIATAHPGVKNLFMSGYTADVIAHHGILEDGLNFISKPFSIKDLSIKLRAILDEQPAS